MKHVEIEITAIKRIDIGGEISTVVEKKKMTLAQRKTLILYLKKQGYTDKWIAKCFRLTIEELRYVLCEECDTAEALPKQVVKAKRKKIKITKEQHYELKKRRYRQIIENEKRDKRKKNGKEK
jgi:hypothetical protein